MVGRAPPTSEGGGSEEVGRASVVVVEGGGGSELAVGAGSGRVNTNATPAAITISASSVLPTFRSSLFSNASVHRGFFRAGGGRDLLERALAADRTDRRLHQRPAMGTGLETVETHNTPIGGSPADCEEVRDAGGWLPQMRSK